jgi:hypothetical protein
LWISDDWPPPLDAADDDVPVATSVDRLRKTGHAVTGDSVDYEAIDEQLQTAESLTDANIIDMLKTNLIEEH